MKKVLFLIAFFSIAATVSMNAQTKAAPLTAAIEAAKNDPNIIQKVGQDGQISFKQKSVCSKSGRVSYKPVEYNAETQSWSAASCSKGNAGSASSCSGSKAKSCGSKGKSCCSGSKGKSCGKKAKSCGSKPSQS
ncbi:MAG TPA: hypothetical protein ENK85_06040 [Saprospiraceae bacterium]|nr:hypothetical protein [Saprospiraceae bacterium]